MSAKSSLPATEAAGARPTDIRATAFVAAFFDPGGMVSMDRVATRLGLSKAQLAETVGLSPDTMYRVQRRSTPRAQARTLELLEIVARVAGWAGGERQALAWYRAEPIAGFGGRTAESLVRDGKASAVRSYLDHVATGGFA